MNAVLITGGAGFIGSNIAIRLKRDRGNIRVVALDNLRRRGSELNITRLQENGVEFIHGDVREKDDLNVMKSIDCILDCSAEPSVLAGYTDSPEYVVNANLIGTLNCLELARKCGSAIIFLSTSRVYPMGRLNDLKFEETPTRYQLTDQNMRGVSSAGLSEEFPIEGTRSLYGATKLASELIMQEYLEIYGLRGVINRCGVITGPWQMGKVEQGFIVLWVARHIFGEPLSYIGYGGKGKQVRDILHIDDLYRLLQIQMNHLSELSGQVFNVGGGREISVSLRELTTLCEEATGKRIPIHSVPDTRPGDVRIYISDCRKVREQTGWMPSIPPKDMIGEIVEWIHHHRIQLQPILAH
jgi:CDP-paratose 2-epimerase